MKNPVSKRGLWWAALLALVSTSGLALWAGEKAKDRDPLVLKSDDTPINRDSALKVSYAGVVKQASPSVVYVFSTKTLKIRNDMAPYYNDPMFRRFFGVPDQGQLCQSHGRYVRILARCIAPTQYVPQSGALRGASCLREASARIPLHSSAH